MQPNSFPEPQTPLPLPPPRREPLLAWWAIFPLMLLLIVEVHFGWKNAHVRASAPEFAISYLMGQIVGALLISLLIAWIAYRAAGRSQIAGTLAFTVMALIACVPVIEESRMSASPGSSPSASQNADLMKFRDQPILAIGGLLRVNFPVGMKYEDDNAQHMLVLQLSGSPSGKYPEFVARMITRQLRSADNLSSAELRLTDTFKKRMSGGERIEWHTITGPTPRAMTNVFHDTLDEGDPQSMMALVDLGSNQVALIYFFIYTSNPTQLSTLTRTAEDIVKTVSRGPAEAVPFQDSPRQGNPK